MSQRFRVHRCQRLRTVLVVAGCLEGLFLLGAGAVPGADRKAGAKEKVGQCVAVTGGLLQRQDMDEEWKRVQPKDTVSAGALLLALPGSKAEIDAGNGSVRLTLAGNLPELALLPLLESAVVMRRPGNGLDLDFTLDRGRVIVANKGKTGVVKARVRLHGQTWDLTLRSPGAEVAVETFARWVVRPASVEKPDKNERPVTTAVLIMLKGEASLQAGSNEYLLRAPPGPALFSWSGSRGAQGPIRLKDTPPWAKADAAKSKEARAALARVEKLGKAMENTTVSSALAEALQSKDSGTRVLAVYWLGASDDLGAVLGSLENAAHRDVRIAAIDELGHWLGRESENMPMLFKVLREKQFSPAHARITIHLLQPFSRAQLARPETYALLIEYLKHDRLAVRELAFWHLSRLAPEESHKISYDPTADESKLKAAYAKWKKELPDGQLPRKPKPKPTKKD
jgi:hypothetical protein